MPEIITKWDLTPAGIPPNYTQTREFKSSSVAPLNGNTEFIVSVPIPAMAKLATTLAPIPPDDPPGVRIIP